MHAPDNVSEIPAPSRVVGLAPQRWLAVSLLALGFALTFGDGDWWARALLAAHYGAFLLWQPILRAEARLGWIATALVLGLGSVIVASPLWWVVGLWIAVLIAIVGGQAAGASGRFARVAHGVALVYLASLLLLWVVPHFLDPGFHAHLATMVARYGLAVLAGVVLALPAEAPRQDGGNAVDLFYAVLLFLLTLVVVLGCLVLVVAAGEQYAVALMKTTITLALALAVVSWLWNPRGGFAGAGQLLSRYLLSVGLPFERWMGNLAALAESEPDPDVFLRRALDDLSGLPWLSGAHWQGLQDTGEIGVVTPHAVRYSFHGLTLTWFGRRALSATLILHVRLITQLLGWFYAAKRRERVLAANAYTQAIHETGARLTHDVKNLLQSMKGLVSAAEAATPDQATAFTALVQRQLPQITQRLQATLDKLKRPEAATIRTMQAEEWWAAVRRRYEREPVIWGDDPLDDSRPLPADLMDSVLENLLSNALRKRQEMPGIDIRVSLECADRIALTVCDSGPAAAPGIARRLFEAPVASDAGLGIGLYQAAKQAAETGWTLGLHANRDGEVSFRLEEGERTA